LFDQKKGKWTDELPKIIWSHNTTVSRATGFTPFRLLFGTKAMTPEEIKNESMRVMKGKKSRKSTKIPPLKGFPPKGWRQQQVVA
jgi:hypothetical protein